MRGLRPCELLFYDLFRKAWVHHNGTTKRPFLLASLLDLALLLSTYMMSDVKLLIATGVTIVYVDNHWFSKALYMSLDEYKMDCIGETVDEILTVILNHFLQL